MKPNYIDIIILIILVIDFFSGIRIGAVSFVFNILSLIGGWFISRSLFLNFASFLTEHTGISTWISNTISPFLKVPESIANLSASIENLKQALAELPLPSFLEDFIVKDFSFSFQNVQGAIVSSVSRWILNGISFLIIFVITFILIRLIGIILHKVIKFMPFLRWVDVLFGGVFKVLISCIIILIVIEVLVSIGGFLNFSESSFIMSVKNSSFYNNMSKMLPFVKVEIADILSRTGR